MSQVTRTQSFTYKGELLEFPADMKLLRSLHNVCVDGRTSLVGLANSIAAQQPDIFTLAGVLRVVLAAADQPATESSCYAWVATGANGQTQEMTEFMAAILNIVFPEVDVGKKPEGQPRPQTTKARRSKAK